MEILNPIGRRWSGPARLLALGLTLILAFGVHAEAAESDKEYEVKARYLHTFTKYTEWPAEAFTNATAPLVIGVLGEDPFGKLLDQTVKDKLSQDRKVVVQRSRRVEELRGCHLLFISRSEKKRLPEILSALRDTRVLTVCDEDSFLEQGVMIRLLVVEEAVRFEVKLGPAERAGLKFNSRMLDAAKRVWPKPSGSLER